MRVTFDYKKNNYYSMRFYKRFLLVSLFGTLLIGFAACGNDKDPVDDIPSLPISVTGITIEPSSLSMNAGDSVVLTATINPSDATTDLTWTSSNEKVATVENGRIKTLARGNATITAEADGVSARCVISVTKTDAPYQLVWSDEFDETTLNTSVWNYETGGGGWGNQEKQHYTDRTENIRLEDGFLIIQARKENYGANAYTSARITTKGKTEFKYGKIEARISLPSGKGTWPAFWMMGGNYDIARWPLCGEIDIMEHVGSDPRMISHAVHTSEKNGSRGNNWSSKKYFDDIENNFHVYAIEWEEKANEGDDCINFYVDGVLTASVWEQHVNSSPQNWPFNREFFIILNMAIGGTWGGTIDDSIFDSPVEMKVDYVRVYQRI